VKKIYAVMFLLFIVGMLAGCASPGSLRKDGAAFIFTTQKSTPIEFGRCLVSQLDEILYLNMHSLRNNPDGNVTILTYAGGRELKFMFDINREDNGLSILCYFSYCNKAEDCRDFFVFPLIAKGLNACGAKEKATIKQE
jgi:hypothetical protein